LTALNITIRSSVISEHEHREQHNRHPHVQTAEHEKTAEYKKPVLNAQIIRSVFCRGGTAAHVQRAAQTQLAAMLMLSCYTTSNSDSLNGGERIGNKNV